jgi:protein-L-isoaspartate(D-aspartate) O-methyltransferase
VGTVTQKTIRDEQVIADHARFLITTAGRSPSVHNTQPWRFRVQPAAIEVYCDPRRKLRTDPLGREMLISCGAAVFGLRLAMRGLGYRPVVELLPDPNRTRLVARVSAGAAAPVTGGERQMLEAIPHRHTHRGPFEPGPLPAGLLAGLQHDALAEGAELVLVERGLAYERLADIVGTATRRLDRDPQARADTEQWTRDADSRASDGVPALAFAARGRPRRGRLPQRDFDLDRGLAQLTESGEAPSATAVLLTAGDRRVDWVHAGQALQRVLLHAASKWVFASLHTQPLEAMLTRDLIRNRLALPGNPQMLLQFGCVRTTHPTARRPAAGAIRSPEVERAFRKVERHRLLETFYYRDGTSFTAIDHDPEAPRRENLELIYAANALATRQADGMPTSSTSLPALVAQMLELLELSAGQKVLEIGAGTGYNAALLAEITGDQRLVTTVDVQADVVEQTGRLLAGAGYPRIQVLVRDGFDGVPELAPFDRIVATVGCSDLSPHWVEQLADDGAVLIPLEHAGSHPLAVVRQDRGALRGRVVQWTGFMPVRGPLHIADLWPRGVVAAEAGNSPGAAMADRASPPADRTDRGTCPTTRPISCSSSGSVTAGRAGPCTVRGSATEPTAGPGWPRTGSGGGRTSR